MSGASVERLGRMAIGTIAVKGVVPPMDSGVVACA
jgi:hypothetical protein